MEIHSPLRHPPEDRKAAGLAVRKIRKAEDQDWMGQGHRFFKGLWKPIRFVTGIPDFLTRKLNSMGNPLSIANLKIVSLFWNREKLKSLDAASKTAN
jgi:hypothetical protein